jgi:xanthine dehydrogenase iron-sulfur cluster and FAD-binding subunit A
MSSRPIRFFHRGAVVEVDGVAPTRTVLDWLREDARCTGTKEGCNEGDCGACTVVVGELPGAAHAGSPELVGGLRLTTDERLPAVPADRSTARRSSPVEDLSAGSELHPAQEDELHPGAAGRWSSATARSAASAPRGFVMSLWATYQHHGARGTRPTRPAARRRALGQPLPLHRLPADPRRRRAACSTCPPRRSTRRRRARRSRRCGRRRETFRYAAGGAELVAPEDAHCLRRRTTGAARRAHPRRLDRHRPLGQQAAASPARAALRLATSTR